jgi:hypothetical protein
MLDVPLVEILKAGIKERRFVLLLTLVGLIFLFNTHFAETKIHIIRQTVEKQCSDEDWEIFVRTLKDNSFRTDFFADVLKQKEVPESKKTELWVQEQTRVMNQEFTIKQQMNNRNVTLIYHGLRLEGALVILRKMISCAEKSAYLQGLNMKLAPIKLLEPEFLVQKPNIKSFFIEFLATIYLAFIVGVVKHFLYKTRDRN